LNLKCDILVSKICFPNGSPRTAYAPAEDHTIDRYATREMVCMACSARQPSAKECRECGVTVARYFCSVCNFWDDSEDRDVYHCPFCNVCRRGEGLGKDFFHCMQCNSVGAVHVRESSLPIA
jgi:zinc finger-like protein